MLSQLLSRPVWQQDRVRLAREGLQLMPAGALDAVNTWAYDLFDDPIIVEQGERLGSSISSRRELFHEQLHQAAGTGCDPSIVAGRRCSPRRAASPSGRASRRGRRRSRMISSGSSKAGRAFGSSSEGTARARASSSIWPARWHSSGSSSWPRPTSRWSAGCTVPPGRPATSTRN